MLVFVLNKHGEPLMPCKPRKARMLLKEKKAKIVSYEPFTIQLLYGSSGYKQETTIGIDTGAKNIGVKPVTVRTWIKKKSGIPAHKIGKQWKFKCSELDEWVKSGKSAIE